MIRFALALMMFASVTQASPFPPLAQSSLQAVWKGLEDCGLKKVDAYHPSLPRPQTPADLAIVNSNGQVLAYYLEVYGIGATALFKNLNGGMVHRVSYGREAIQYLTPYAGTIAHGNRFMTVGGPGYNLYCRSQPVNANGFQACIQQRFINVIVGQLCRFAQ